MKNQKNPFSVNGGKIKATFDLITTMPMHYFINTHTHIPQVFLKAKGLEETLIQILFNWKQLQKCLSHTIVAMTMRHHTFMNMFETLHGTIAITYCTGRASNIFHSIVSDFATAKAKENYKAIKRCLAKLAEGLTSIIIIILFFILPIGRIKTSSFMLYNETFIDVVFIFTQNYQILYELSLHYSCALGVSCRY
uniref:Uncharacterized protein n=1 Tax=Glossina brevipalpis TaxID=37001 RepID=A0A1A9X2T6_9MUSC